jgi:prepilin-type N-terminal cleavage/methylation domain-containing protein
MKNSTPSPGFTLVELAVALLIFAIGALSLAALIPLGTHTTAKAGDETRASEIASMTCERLIATPYGDADLTPGNHQGSPYPMPGDYYLTWSVAEHQPDSFCKRVTVDVHWPHANSLNRVRMTVVNPRANADN